MEIKYAIKNGELIKPEDANISVFNKAFFFDFAVYSNIKVVQGKMFLPETEINRLFESAANIGIEHKFKKEEIMGWCKLLIEKNKLSDALVRLLLIGPEQNQDTILFLFPVGLTFYSKKLYNEGAKLITFKAERFMPNTKSMDLLAGYVAYREAAKHNAIDALLVGKDGNITEGTRCSFFAIKGDTLIAPPKEKVLEGITRRIITELAKSFLKVEEKDIPLDTIQNYDEYFITGTTLNIMPIKEIDDFVLSKKVGEKTKKLQELFKEYCEKNK